MGNGAWSNDQLNSLYIYSATTGKLLLSVDAGGLYMANTADGSFFKVESRPSTVGSQDIIAVELQPPNSVVPGVTYSFAELVADEFLLSAGHVIPELVISSPYSTGKKASLINLQGQTNTSSADDSVIYFYSAYLANQYGNQIGQGTLDEGGAGSAGYTSANFTGTEIAADYSDEFYGTYSTTRRYMVLWSGTVQSSTAGDRIGLRVYTGPNQNNLTGATQIRDYGQITIAAANTPQPFHIAAPFNGVPGQNALLGARRVSGSGTCFLTTNARHCFDTVASY